MNYAKKHSHLLHPLHNKAPKIQTVDYSITFVVEEYVLIDKKL